MVTLVILLEAQLVMLPYQWRCFRLEWLQSQGRTETSCEQSLSVVDKIRIRGVLNRVLYGVGGGGAPTRGATSYPFIYHFWLKRYPFRSPSINKWHPFHIPSLELCIPFKWCNCSLQNINKSVRFLDFFTAMKSVCSLFWAFLTTEMTDFSTLSYT